MASVLVDVLILFRGLRLDLSFVEFLTHTLSSLGSALAHLLSPLQALLGFLALFKVDLAAVSVVCPGASAPVNLLIDYFVLGAVVVVMGSDYQIFRATALGRLLERFVALSLSPSYKKLAAQHKKSRLSLLLYSALAMAVNSVVNYQLILRLFMSLVRFDFLSKMKLALAPSNVCNRVEGMQGLDQWLACIVFVCAAFVLLPLVYEIGKAVVQSLPPSVPASSQKGTADYRIKQLSVATDVIRSYRKKTSEHRKNMSSELDAIAVLGQADASDRGHKTTEGVNDSYTFRALDVALWLPSFLAPDLWICWLSNSIIRKAQQAIPRDSSSPGQDKAQTQRRVLSACKETTFVLRRMPFCLSPDSLFVSVLVPVHEDDDYRYDADAKDASTKRFESQPSFVELEARLKLLPPSDQEQDSQRIQQSLEFRRWMNHCRRHQLPPYNELIELYSSNLGDFTGAFKALPLYLTMGLTNHVVNPYGRAVARQVALNFLVFVSSSLGWWSRYTRDYYGVAVCANHVSQLLGLELGLGPPKGDRRALGRVH